MNIPLQVTPESMAAWCEAAEFQWLLAIILQESQESREVCQTVPVDNQPGVISKHQGIIALANRLLKDDFRDVLIQSVEVETKKDGGQSLLFEYKIHVYRQGNNE